jgi:hypothetical protein
VKSFIFFYNLKTKRRLEKPDLFFHQLHLLVKVNTKNDHFRRHSLQN